MSSDPTARFSDRVESYVRYRPGYPPELPGFLARTLGLAPGAPLCELGAGTGILTRALLDAGFTVHAVEPNAPMAAAAVRALGARDGFTAVAAPAEDTGLPAASFDAVLAAQAFHWFDVPRVARECRRILRPGGGAALLWNERLIEETPFLAAYEAFLQRWGTDYAAVRRTYQDPDALATFFGAGGYRRSRFPNIQRFDFEGLRGRLLSSSYAPAAGHPDHLPMLDGLRALFEQHAAGGQVEILYSTDVYTGAVGEP